MRAQAVGTQPHEIPGDLLLFAPREFGIFSVYESRAPTATAPFNAPIVFDAVAAAVVAFQSRSATTLCG